jgi:hypothetical protein
MGKRVHTITAPLAIFLPRKTMADKKYIINLNNTKSRHFIVLNQIKKAYKEAIRSQIEGITFTPMVRIEMTYWKPTSRRSDRSNVLCVHEKFALDAMVELGCLEDDSDEYVFSTTYLGGTLDRGNPRVEIKIIEI